MFNMVHQDRLRQGESILQLVHRVEQAMKLGGVGTKTSFSLGYDSLLITMVVALLPQANQAKLYECFQSYDFTVAELKDWAGVCDTAAIPVHSKAAGKVAAIKAKGVRTRVTSPRPPKGAPTVTPRGTGPGTAQPLSGHAATVEAPDIMPPGVGITRTVLFTGPS